MNTNFRIDFITSDEFEFLAAEISFREQLLCRLYRSNADVIKIEFMEERRILKADVRLMFPLDDFVETVRIAREDLMSLRL